MEATDIYGVVGSGYNDWGATPDGIFTRDWSRPFDDIWILNNATLIDEAKSTLPEVDTSIFETFSYKDFEK